MDIGWDTVVMFLRADGYYAWQLHQKLKNKPKALVLWSFAHSALNRWMGGGCSWQIEMERNGHRTPWASFSANLNAVWIERVQGWPIVGLRSQDAWGLSD